jgi:hypothetical protein
MSRTRLILLGLLAVVAVGAVIASTSGAEPPAASCTSVTKTPIYCVAGVPLANGASAEVEGTDGVSMFSTTVGMVKTEIECKKGKAVGAIEGVASGTVGKSSITNKIEECKLLKPTNCKLTAANESKIKTAELDGVLTLTSGRIEDKLAPPESGFADISIEGRENSCVIAEPENPKTFEVSGSQLCEIDKANSEAETEATTHKLICKTSGGSLKLGTNGAEMTSESTVKLVSGKKWSVKENT